MAKSTAHIQRRTNVVVLSHCFLLSLLTLFKIAKIMLQKLKPTVLMFQPIARELPVSMAA